MLSITEIKSYIADATERFQVVYEGAEIVPVVVCPSSRRSAVRNKVLSECGLTYKEDIYGTDAEVINGPLGMRILIYQSLTKSKRQVFHALWHEFGHILYGDETQYGIDTRQDTPMRSGYAIFNEFIAEYIAYTVNEMEPFSNSLGAHIYLQMAFQSSHDINPYWLSRYFAVVLGDATVSDEEFTSGQQYVTPVIWHCINQMVALLVEQIKKPDFWIADAEYIEKLGTMFDEMYHLVFIGKNC